MAGEVIANFDLYAMVAVGLFIAGIFAVMVYERSSAKAKREQQQQQQQRTGTAADTEK
jgi:FlaG/FlaF family flagellin (archaellin)